MTRNPRLYLSDILESIEKIQQYTADITFESFQNASIIKDAVARNFEIIGEAAAHMPDKIQERYRHIPWYKMKAMRNIMAHEYFRVDLRIVWESVHQDLPQLLPQIKRVLSELDQ